MDFYAIEDHLVHSYTRQQAMADRMLVDISEVATKVGFRAPVAMTKNAWADCVWWPQTTTNQKVNIQTEEGRLCDVVYAAMLAVKPSEGLSRTVFDVYRVPATGKRVKPRRTTLVMQIGTGDIKEPVITISMPGEI